jgi:hypothetical protein
MRIRDEASGGSRQTVVFLRPEQQAALKIYRREAEELILGSKPKPGIESAKSDAETPTRRAGKK